MKAWDCWRESPLRFTIKLGGSILEDPQIREHILRQVSRVWGEGHEIVLVHGGGKSLSRRLEQLGIACRAFWDSDLDGQLTAIATGIIRGEARRHFRRYQCLPDEEPQAKAPLLNADLPE